MIKKANRNDMRKKRHYRLRRKIIGTAERPRLNVFRSSKNIYAQLIDDSHGVTLVSASTVDQGLRDKLSEGTATDFARTVGSLLAERALAKGLDTVVFDRGGYVYHGQVAAVADGAREGGLKF